MMTEIDIRRAARELFNRHGDLALQLAYERAERLSRLGDQPTLCMALRVLTEVERLVGKPRQPRYPMSVRVH